MTKVAAHHVEVYRALRDGRLVRPANCQLCGEEVRVIAVHRDVSRPLEVTWICHWCRRCLADQAAGRPLAGARLRRAPPPAPLARIPCVGFVRSRGKPCGVRARYTGADGYPYCKHHLPPAPPVEEEG